MIMMTDDDDDRWMNDDDVWMMTSMMKRKGKRSGDWENGKKATEWKMDKQRDTEKKVNFRYELSPQKTPIFGISFFGCCEILIIMNNYLFNKNSNLSEFKWERFGDPKSESQKFPEMIFLGSPPLNTRTRTHTHTHTHTHALFLFRMVD